MTAHRSSFELYVVEIIRRMPKNKHHYLDYFYALENELKRKRIHFSYAENRAHEIVSELERRAPDGTDI
jgi:hypothetical protein